MLYYDLNKISLNRGGSYIKSPEWLEDKQATINPQNKNDDNCFQYALTVALNYKKINKNCQRISKKLKTFINQYNWKDIDFPSTGKDRKKFELNNKSIALNILYMPQVILLMITDGEKWHYLAVKSLSALLNGIISNHNGNFYCLNCFRAYTTKNKKV